MLVRKEERKKEREQRKMDKIDFFTFGFLNLVKD